MVIDPEKLVESLKREKEKSSRGRVTLYLDKDLMATFKKLCAPIAPSKVVEEFVRQFVNSSKKKIK